MDHYFIENENLKEDLKTFKYYFKGEEFEFTTNSGIFSPGHVDVATGILMSQIPQSKGSLLDLGCGYGVVGIVLGRINGITPTMSDVNDRALRCAEHNCKANGVKARIIKSDGFDNIEDSFDTIVLNPPIHAGKDTVYRLYEESFDHLNLGGAFYIVILEKHGGKSSIKKLKTLFGNCETVYKKSGMYVLKAVRE